MDESKKYIEMCREAWKYLQREIEYEDVVAYRYTYDGYVGEGVDCFFWIAEKWQIKEDCKDTYIFVVWKQDQLQGMITNKGYFRFSLIELFYRFCHAPIVKKKSEYVEPYMVFSSMQQLWLAFVMEVKYNKIWADDKKEWKRAEPIKRML